MTEIAFDFVVPYGVIWLTSRYVQCPPDNATYIAALQANVAAGFAVNNTVVAVPFPTDDSSASLATRINAALVTLQNLEGAGKGCPGSSTTLVVSVFFHHLFLSPLVGHNAECGMLCYRRS